MRKLMAGVCTGLAFVAVAACGAPSADVADISVVTVLPKEVGPGGFQSTLEADGVGVGYFYQSTIADCGSVVVDTARAWASRHGWTEAEGQIGDRAAVLRLEPEGSSGAALVIRYSLASDRSLARVRITREWGSDEPTPSAGDPGGVGVSELVDAEVVAARCERGG